MKLVRLAYCFSGISFASSSLTSAKIELPDSEPVKTASLNARSANEERFKYSETNLWTKYNMDPPANHAIYKIALAKNIYDIASGTARRTFRRSDELKQIFKKSYRCLPKTSLPGQGWQCNKGGKEYEDFLKDLANAVKIFDLQTKYRSYFFFGKTVDDAEFERRRSFSTRCQRDVNEALQFMKTRCCMENTKASCCQGKGEGISDCQNILLHSCKFETFMRDFLLNENKGLRGRDVEKVEFKTTFSSNNKKLVSDFLHEKVYRSDFCKFIPTPELTPFPAENKGSSTSGGARDGSLLGEICNS